MPVSFFLSHTPRFIVASAAGTERASDSISASACSATLTLLRARRVHDDDAARAGGGDVDVVDAGAGAGNHPKFRRGGDQRLVDGRRAADDEGVGIGEIAREVGGRAAGFGVDGAAGKAREQSDRGGRQLIGDDDVHGVTEAGAVNVASGRAVGQVRVAGARAFESIGPNLRSTKYNLQSRSRHVRAPRTNVVQSGPSAGMMRIRGRFANDFHNLFHSFCEDPVTPAGDVT